MRKKCGKCEKMRTAFHPPPPLAWGRGSAAGLREGERGGLGVGGVRHWPLGEGAGQAASPHSSATHSDGGCLSVMALDGIEWNPVKVNHRKAADRNEMKRVGNNT